MKKLTDAARIDRIKFAVIPENTKEDIMEFSSLEDVRFFVETQGLKYFYVFDVDDEDNFIKINKMYMYKYTVRDLKDRLLANKRGDNFKAKY